MPQSVAPADSTQPANPYPQVSGIVTIEAPKIKEGTEQSNSPKLDLEERSIRNTDQAWDLCKGCESSNKSRSMRATVIELEYSGQPPNSTGENIQKAHSWQSNVCTGILSGLVDRKVLRFVNAITGQAYLTRSALPTTWPDWKKKSDLFCIHTTRFIQGWNGYSTFVNMLAKEDVLHGYAYAVFPDPYTWKPQCFKQDLSWVPEESPQHAKDLQFFCIKKDYLLNEFIDLFRDEQAAEDMGYNIKNCTIAANKSQVKNPREDMVVSEFRKFAEFIQDGILGMTYATTGSRVVKTYLLWNREYDGKVSFWIISRDDGKLLRFASKIYDSMDQVVSLFSFQPGNSHLHSSKGLGRMLIGNVKVAEKLRNRMFDNVHLSSMKILKTDAKDRSKMQAVQMAPFLVVDKSVEFGESQFDADYDGYANLDQRMASIMEQAAGVWISSDSDDGKQPDTATESSLDAKREQENQDMTESRWRDQYQGCLVQEMQRRACADDNIAKAQKIYTNIISGQQETYEVYAQFGEDGRLVRYIVDMLKDGLAIEEIKVLRMAPASGYAHTDDGITANGILAAQKMFVGNNNVDHVLLDKRAMEAVAGPDAAKELMIDSPDQTVAAEASRMQLTESSAMSTLQIPIPVSPRDNHILHGEVLVSLLTSLGQVLSSGNTAPAMMKNIEMNLNHLGSHLEAYLAQGGVSQNPQFKQQNDFYNKFKIDLEKAVNIMAHAQVASQMPTPEGADAVMKQAGSAPVSSQQGGGAAAGTVQGGSSPVNPGVPDNIEGVQEAAPPPAA